LPVSLNPSRRGRSFQVLIRMDVSICCVSQPLPAREVISSHMGQLFSMG